MVNLLFLYNYKIPYQLSSFKKFHVVLHCTVGTAVCLPDAVFVCMSMLGNKLTEHMDKHTPSDWPCCSEILCDSVNQSAVKLFKWSSINAMGGMMIKTTQKSKK